MEFNPLDLLASAAELQQKNDDGPERIIVTRQRRNNQSTAKHAMSDTGQKENREIHNNNNTVKGKAKPSVVIVKKIKLDHVNPELEKMFDEHNYGTSKKANKYEQADEYSSDLNKRKKKSEANTTPCQSSKHETVSSESETSEEKTVLISVGSQAGDSNCVRVGKCSVNCSQDKSTCLNTGSHCSSNGTVNGSSQLENETRENKCTACKDSVCSCRTVTEQPDSIGGQNKVNSTTTGDKQPQHMVMKYKGLRTDCGILGENSELLKTDVDSLKLDDKTGEFVTESGTKVIIKSLTNEQEESKSYTDSTGDLKGKSLEEKQKSTESEKVVHRMVAVKNAKNLKLDSSAVKSTSIITSAKMPYVKVIPSKEISSEAVLDRKPETLVINISPGQNSSAQLTKAALDDKSSQLCETNNMCGTDTSSSVPTNTGSNKMGIIKSVVVNGSTETKKNGEVITKPKPMVFTVLSPKSDSKLEMSSCDSPKFHTTSSCEPLKALELTDTLCSEESVSSVHLLSPDRRNPDSMGIVESPVTQSCSDFLVDGNEKDKLTFPFVYDKSEKETAVVKEETKSGIEEQDSVTGIQSDSVINTFGSKESDHLDSAMDLQEHSSDVLSDTRELMKESRLEPSETQDRSDNSAKDDSVTDSGDNEVPIFRFDSDHCYAGLPGSTGGSAVESMTTKAFPENETSVQSESEEVQTPLSSASELSQDSGYEDVTHSPDTTPVTTTSTEENVGGDKPVLKNLVPVLVSVNTNGSLTLHDTNLTKGLAGPVLALPDNLSAINSGIKVIQGNNLSATSQPLILSPVGKSTSPVLAEGARLIPAKQKSPESIIELLCAKGTEQPAGIPVVQAATQQASPPKFGTFKIGTFASFSNTGMGLENTSKTSMESQVKPGAEEKSKKPAQRTRSNSGKSSPGADTLSTLVQKVKGSLSQTPSQPADGQNIDHIQHDHDYCTKNLMPAVVSSLLEARLTSKDTGKGKTTHGKVKKSEYEQARELHKSEMKSGKRKRNSSSLTKLDSLDEFDVDSESDTQSIPEPIKPKSRLDRFMEKSGRTTDPKVKITGSSNFQDQFVYFMNTKKRSRRRESKDAPLPFGDRVFIPPKPGDIIVPHLTDQDIENLKQRSKQFKQSGNMSGFNSLRNEFMAAKYANTPYSGLFSSSTTEAAPTAAADDEKNIINTILSMENESLASPVQSDPPSYNESMEMYGQGLGNDLMNLFPEQMNLTQEQMDLLYSAVDEVQNSSPGLIGAEKLVSTDSGDSTFGEFSIPEYDSSGLNDATRPVAATETVTMDTSTKVEGSANTAVPAVAGSGSPTTLLESEAPAGDPDEGNIPTGESGTATPPPATVESATTESTAGVSGTELSANSENGGEIKTEGN